MSGVTYHISLLPTATTTDPTTSNSPSMLDLDPSEMNCKDPDWQFGDQCLLIMFPLEPFYNLLIRVLSGNNSAFGHPLISKVIS